MKPIARGIVPPVLYRYFCKAEFAESFLTGAVRMGLLRGYAVAEDDARADPMEGRGEFSFPDLVQRVSWDTISNEVRRLDPVPGRISVSSYDTTPTYVYCFSKRYGEDLAQKFGRFVVRVTSPRAFLDRLAKAAETRPDLFGPLECGAVVYDSSPVLNSEPTAEDLITQCSFTKHERFRVEDEYRVVQWRNRCMREDGGDICPDNAITLQAGDLRDVAELMELTPHAS